MIAALEALCLFYPVSAYAQNWIANSSIYGHVFVRDSTGNSFVPGASIVLRGSKELKTETDMNGLYHFSSIQPGRYVITATAPGLSTQQIVIVKAGVSAEVSLELKLISATTSVTVTGNIVGTDIANAAQVIEQKTVEDAPNADQRFESLLPLVPGVVRSPDGRINMKGARSTQSGALVNSANVTDPALGGSAINLPIDVVSSVQVISNSFDPQYGRFTGALSTVETKTGNYQKAHFSIQNILPRWRDRAGSIAGIGSATPRFIFTGPLIKNRVALTQSAEYRFIRTPVNSLPPLQRDTKLEGFTSFTQADLNLTPQQTATLSLTVYPQKLNYMGLNTFTPQDATADFRQRGFQVYAQHRYLTGSSSALISQFSYKTYDVDVSAQSDNTYKLFVDTTAGGFFSRQHRRSSRYELEQNKQFSAKQLWGTHQFKAGWNYAYSDLRGIVTSLPVEVIAPTGSTLEQIDFSSSSWFSLGQNEVAFYAADQWSPSTRLSLTYGIRFDGDTVTGSTHVAPRGSVTITLSRDGKTLLKAGAGIFYDRVPLLLPNFERLPERTVTVYDLNGQNPYITSFTNRIIGSIENPRSTTWNVELDRQVTKELTVRVAYESRNTARNFIVTPIASGQTGTIALSNGGSDSYREFQVTGQYQVSRATLNASYVHSRAYGDLNDPFLFFGNYPQAVIQPNQKGRQTFDAPNRYLFWANIDGPWKLNLVPVYDLHTGFPYSVENEYREYVGPRSSKRFPRFSSADLQITRPFTLHVKGKLLKVSAGGAVFNVFNHFNPRDVQNNLDSSNFGYFYNDAWREYRGKLVFKF
jgi:hypothetical protein